MAGIENFLNTTEGMECLVNNKAYDDNSYKANGVDWFRFNGATASEIYVNGNMWLGFGASSEQLKPYRRDGKMWYLYRQEGTCDGVQFLKLRWEGYTVYNKTTADYRLIYEHFLFADGRMFLNVLQAPTSSSYFGTSSLVCGSNTYAMNLGVDSGCPYRYLFTPGDAEGSTWTLEAGTLPTFASFRYIVADAGHTYKVGADGLEAVADSCMLGENPAPALGAWIQANGGTAAPSALQLSGLQNPKWAVWTEAPEAKAATGRASAVPPAQTVTAHVSMVDPSIKGVDGFEVEAEGAPAFQFSADGTTWRGFAGGSWAEGEAMTAAQVNAMTADDLAALIGTSKAFACRATIHENDVLTLFSIKYQN